ncbi:Uncharacterised protein [Mycoplasmopsis californica]|uniref:Uncharacterized protein n=1 Tax=Mycoplasmopsis equigenitalium TaxID=114883 RepID=A0ABY5J0J4_9BACT|nr:hypothetical protein [Mycoplasmopsis equigenitalium]UUD36782.1 hypothetical protein NPA09_02695 [Mycoplasmopsis equigenitalium]VEU69919.1 Uncharacterised protein [Mycoplasmopsis californica]
MKNSKTVFNIGFIASVAIVLVVSLMFMAFGIKADDSTILGVPTEPLSIGFLSGFTLIAANIKNDINPTKFIDSLPDGDLKTGNQLGFAMQIILLIAAVIALVFGILVIIRIFTEKRGLSFILSFVGVGLFLVAMSLLIAYPFLWVEGEIKFKDVKLYGIFSSIFALGSVASMALACVKK